MVDIGGSGKKDGAIAARSAAALARAQRMAAEGSLLALKVAVSARERAEQLRHGQVDNGPIETTDPSEFSDIVESLADLAYGVALAASAVLVGRHIAMRTADDDRQVKMAEVVERQRGVLAESTGLTDPSDADVRGLLLAVAKPWDRSDRLRFLIDIDFGDPFAPYALKHSRRSHNAAVKAVAQLLAEDPAVVDEIEATRKDALGAHHKISVARIALVGGATAAAIALLGFLAAPVLGTALGTAAGLSGAAATAHGLALLGGGALAAGGAGMAGGLWLVTGVGAAAGLISGGGGTALYQLGVAQAESELVKLQVTFKLAILDGQVVKIKAQKVIGSLEQQADELRVHLAEERRLNDDNARRVKDLQAKVRAVEETVAWMREQEAEK